jgi:predicted RNA binding protein YcfA (HicA-like mRNA interferase family)
VAKLPTDLSGRKVRAALERNGFVFIRQKGSHMILRRSVGRRRPSHSQARYAQRHHRRCGLTVDELSLVEVMSCRRGRTNDAS